MAAVAVCLSGHAQNAKTMNGKKTLVAYFSATGTTAKAAQLIATATGGTLHQITPEKAYTSADLNWNNKTSRSTKEMNDAKSRPAIVKNLKGVDDYSVVYIGYPIWWDLAPRAVNTFIEAYDLSGKTIIPFATSGGSTIRNSVSVLKKTYPQLKWQDGRLLNRATQSEVTKWCDSLK